ncbi:hypothetical protein [Ascidiimonas sp. W6]
MRRKNPTYNSTIWEELAALAKRVFGTEEEEPALIPVKVNENYNRHLR